MSTTQSKDKPVTEGYLVGIATLLVTILWMFYARFLTVGVIEAALIVIFFLAFSFM